MLPDRAQLEAALRKVRGDFGATPGILRISVRSLKGKPVILVEGVLVERPSNLPHGFRVLVDAAPYTIPIAWHTVGAARVTVPLPKSTAEDDMPINNDLWAGAPPVGDQPLKLWEPSHAPMVPNLQQIPEAQGREDQLALSMRLPQFAAPNFWARPFYDGADVCMTNYETRTLAFSYQVPSNYLMVITGVSYEFSDLVPFDQFTISVCRDNSELSHWIDMRALNTADPAEEYVFAGHYRPFPYWGRFDHDQWLNIFVTVHGPWPFVMTPSDTLGGCVSLYASGWLGSLYDTRDGGARPVDMGELNDIALEAPAAEAAQNPVVSDVLPRGRHALPGTWQPPRNR